MVFPALGQFMKNMHGLCKRIYFLGKNALRGLPWWSSDETLSFHCREYMFNPWSGNSDSASLVARQREKRCIDMVQKIEFISVWL